MIFLFLNVCFVEFYNESYRKILKDWIWLNLMYVRNAIDLDLENIQDIEQIVEGDDAASFEVLRSRLEMFPEGFLVAEQDQKIIDGFKSLSKES